MFKRALLDYLGEGFVGSISARESASASRYLFDVCSGNFHPGMVGTREIWDTMSRAWRPYTESDRLNDLWSCFDIHFNGLNMHHLVDIENFRSELKQLKASLRKPGDDTARDLIPRLFSYYKGPEVSSSDLDGISPVPGPQAVQSSGTIAGAIMR